MQRVKATEQTSLHGVSNLWGSSDLVQKSCSW